VTLWALFSALATDAPAPDRLLEHTFVLANYPVTLSGADFLPLFQYSWNTHSQLEPIPEYFRSNKFPQHVVVWEGDSFARDAFHRAALVPKPLAAGAASYYFKPLSISTVRYFYRAAILTGSCLFLRIDNIIDPSGGPDVQQIDIKLGESSHTRDDQAIIAIENQRIDQIVCFAFDSSLSMRWALDRRPQGKSSPIDIAKQFVNAFVLRAAAYRVTTCYGFVHFNSDVTCTRDVSCIESDFLTAVADLNTLGQDTALWKGINEAHTCIRRFDPLTGGVPVFSNARLGILIISEGRDNCRGVDPLALARTLRDEGVVVDAVMICTEKEFTDNGELALLVALTSGVAYRPKSPEEGLAFFEQEAFLNLRLRKRVEISADL
jgi:hypothetical protein